MQGITILAQAGFTRIQIMRLVDLAIQVMGDVTKEGKNGKQDKQ
jgi:hypothetical protein